MSIFSAPAVSITETDNTERPPLPGESSTLLIPGSAEQGGGGIGDPSGGGDPPPPVELGD